MTTRLVNNSTEWTSGSTQLIHRQSNPLNRASPYVINPLNRAAGGLARIDEWTRWARGASGRVGIGLLLSPGLLDAGHLGTFRLSARNNNALFGYNKYISIIFRF